MNYKSLFIVAVISLLLGMCQLPSPNKFGEPVKWTEEAVVCHHGCYFADVTGDGKADLIANDNDGLVVVKSNGTGFDPGYEKWTEETVVCHQGCYFADVTGDGKADLIANDNDGLVVLRTK